MHGRIPAQDLHGSRRQPYDTLTGLPLHPGDRVCPDDARGFKRGYLDRAATGISEHDEQIAEFAIIDSRHESLDVSGRRWRSPFYRR